MDPVVPQGVIPAGHITLTDTEPGEMRSVEVIRGGISSFVLYPSDNPTSNLADPINNNFDIIKRVNPDGCITDTHWDL